MIGAILEKPVPAPAADPQATVVERVLAQLGVPKDLFRVDAKPLWANHYRVNVLRTPETEHTVRGLLITDSFFVTLAGDGIVSRPVIKRKY